MIEEVQKIGRKISNAIAIITDWILIASGLLLILIALLRIDVAAAKYFIVVCGVVISLAGFRFRQQRRKKNADNGTFTQTQ